MTWEMPKLGEVVWTLDAPDEVDPDDVPTLIADLAEDCECYVVVGFDTDGMALGVRAPYNEPRGERTVHVLRIGTGWAYDIMGAIKGMAASQRRYAERQIRDAELIEQALADNESK